MFDDLAAYFFDNVVSSYREYRETKETNTAGRSLDLRKAISAAAALFHLREHLLPPNVMSRSEAESLCADFGLLGDIVNVSKHRSLSQKTSHGPPLITDATGIEEIVAVTIYRDEEGEYRSVEKTVIVKTMDGKTRDLYEVITNVMNFWQAHLHGLGIIAKPHQYVIPR